MYWVLREAKVHIFSPLVFVTDPIPLQDWGKELNNLFRRNVTDVDQGWKTKRAAERRLREAKVHILQPFISHALERDKLTISQRCFRRAVFAYPNKELKMKPTKPFWSNLLIF